MSDFKVGDIVYHKKGYICNGKYGEIILDHNDELVVLDNEKAIDMLVKDNEDDLEIVGNVRCDRELLKINP